MGDFVRIHGLSAKEQKKILDKIEEVIARKKKEGLLKEKEIREVEEMRLHPVPDLLDVQSVYEDFLYKKKF